MAKILIVDDQPVNLKVLVDFLRQQDYRLLVAENGQRALERAHEQLPDEGIRACNAFCAAMIYVNKVFVYQVAEDVVERPLGLDYYFCRRGKNRQRSVAAIKAVASRMITMSQ